MPAATREQTGPERLGLVAQLRHLAGWAEQAVELPVIVGPAGVTTAQPDPESHVRIETVRIAVPAVAGDPSQARVDAEVLITVQAPDHAEAAGAVTTLMLKMISESPWQPVPGQPDLDLWTALGVPPRPAFMITLSVRMPLLRQSAPAVRSPLLVQGAELRRVQGRVLSGDGSPLSGARVRLSPGGTPMTTAYDGRWTLVVPNTTVHLDVTARGVRLIHELPSSPDSAADARRDIDIVVAALGVPAEARPHETEAPLHDTASSEPETRT